MRLDPKFTAALQEIELQRGIPRDAIIDALRRGVEAAYEKSYGETPNLEVDIDLQSGNIDAYLSKVVVGEVDDDQAEIDLPSAKEIDETAELGDTIMLEQDITHMGNLAIHTFKQELKSAIRRAEREKVMALYGNRLYELINCTVLYTERGDVYLETPDRVEGILPYEEQIPREKYRPGQRVKCLLTEVRDMRKSPMLKFSRRHPDLLRELMKNEIPEVRENNIEIVAIARDPGYRSKVAVRSKLPELDPVGSCIGSRGIRITAISHEVNDEKIDLVEFKDDPFEFIAEALSPAKVMSVEIFDDERRAVVVVPDDQISLAIGKGWRNVKLASKLTRFKLDVKSVSESSREQDSVPAQEEIEDEDDYYDEDDDIGYSAGEGSAALQAGDGTDAEAAKADADVVEADTEAVETDSPGESAEDEDASAADEGEGD